MSAFHSWRWSALAVIFAVASSAARAEMITPNSIPNPPTAVGSANGTPVSTSNIVNTQYAGFGLNLSGAITKLDNISVWAPIVSEANPSTVAGAISYASSVSGIFVSPGSSNPTTVPSFTFETFGLTGTPTVVGSGLNGQRLNLVPVLQSSNQPFGLQVWTVAGPGISSFSVIPSNTQNGAWGVAGISFTSPTVAQTTPEPSSLILAGLGALGMVGRFGWRRRRAVVA